MISLNFREFKIDYTWIYAWLLVWFFCSVHYSNSEALGRQLKGAKLQHVEVVKIIDGDSFRVKNGIETKELRLWGIDAPEFDQPYSKEAKLLLKHLIKGKFIYIDVKYADKYGRDVVIATTDKLNVNLELVKAGGAWVYEFFCDEEFCKDWMRAQQKAKRNRVGLFKDQTSVPPWIWKKKGF